MAEKHNLEEEAEKCEIIILNCPLCNFSGDQEKQVIKHLEDVHKLVDNEPKKINKPCRYHRQNRCSKGQDCKFLHEEKNDKETFKDNNEERNKSNPKKCKHGLKCTYLKQNRCSFYHDEAAQPRQQSNPRQTPQVNRTDPRPIPGHGHKSYALSSHVKMCRDSDMCNRGIKCRFRHYTPSHYEEGFHQRSSNKIQ